MIAASLVLAVASSSAAEPEGFDRIGPALEQAELSVSGAWADGRAVVVEVTLKRLDRVLDPLQLTLDRGLPVEDFRCVHPEQNTWQHCGLDEGPRRIRARFTTQSPRGTHALDWHGKRVATFEVKGPGAPVFPRVDEQEAERLEARVPKIVAVTAGVPVNDALDFEAEPARRLLVTDVTLAAVPPTFLPEDLDLELVDPETGDGFDDAGVEALVDQCWTNRDGKTVELLDCAPLPEAGILRTVWSIPLDAALADLVADGADDALAEPVRVGPEAILPSIPVDTAVLEWLDEPGEPLPIEPIRIWRAEWSVPHLWADFRIDGPIAAVPGVDDLHLYDPAVGEPVTVEWPQVECYADDPDAGPAEPVACAEGGWMRAGWPIPDIEAPPEVVVGSGGVGLDLRMEVLAEGPVFSDTYTALRLLELGDAAGAIPYLDRALIAAPDDAALRYHRAYAAWATEAFAEAAGLAEAALAVEGARALTPEDRIETWKVLANAALALEGGDGAEPVLLAARAEQPDVPAFPMLLATVAEERLDFADAEAWLVEAHAIARRIGAERSVVAEIDARLAHVMRMLDEPSLSTLALFRSLLADPRGPGSDEARATLRERLTMNTTWVAGDALRGPLTVVTSGRVKVKPDDEDYVETAVEQLTEVVQGWNQAQLTGQKGENLSTSPWYQELSAVVSTLVAEDRVEEAAWLALAEPGEWPVRLNWGVGLVERSAPGWL
jgi:tetratricopeptide (TPR) repeat protein